MNPTQFPYMGAGHLLYSYSGRAVIAMIPGSSLQDDDVDNLPGLAQHLASVQKNAASIRNLKSVLLDEKQCCVVPFGSIPIVSCLPAQAVRGQAIMRARLILLPHR